MLKENLILVCTEAQGLIPPIEIKRKKNKQVSKMIFQKKHVVVLKDFPLLKVFEHYNLQSNLSLRTPH